MSASRAQRSTPTRHWRSSRLALCWCVLVCLLGSATLVGCTPSLQGLSPHPTPSAGAQLSSAWTGVLNQIGPNGEVSLATALQAYTLVFGPLPDVQSAPNAGDDGLIGSGTLAERIILQHYHELTPTQQQAVLQRLGYAAPASAQVAPAGAARVAAEARARLHPLGPTPTPTTTQVVTNGSGTAIYSAMVNAFIPKLDAALSYTFTVGVALGFDTSLKQSVEGYAEPVDAKNGFTGPPALCRIFINPIVNSFSADRQQFIIAHELFHCYQTAIMGSIAAVYAAPSWLIEGSAHWAGAVVSGATSAVPELQVMWVWWLTRPDIPLLKWTYPAIGFFALLNHEGISPWKVLPAMLLSQTKGTAPDNLAAYQAGTQSGPQKVLDAWASSIERNSPLGSDWDLTGPGIVAASSYGGPPIHAMTLGNGPTPVISTSAYTAVDYDLTSQADVVHVYITGTSRLHDSASFERVTSANGNYCTKNGGCDCPSGSAYQGLPLPQLTGLLHLAVTGGPTGANGVVSGLTLEQFCNKQKPTAVPPITAAFCQSVMTMAQANAIMQPPTPATSIRVDNSPAVGSCNYEYAQFKSVVSVLFLLYTGPQTPQAEQNGLEAAASKITDKGGTVTTTMVSGVGDAAMFVTATFAPLPLKQANLVVIYGAVVLVCFNPDVVSASFASQQTELTQVCQRVVNVLDP